MKNGNKYVFNNFIIFAIFLGVISCSRERNISFSETVKVSFRDVGHQLLLVNQDSVTLVKPVVTINELKFQLSFEKQLAILPDSLVAFVKKSFQKANLPQDYLIEVLQCSDKEVAYSFRMKQNIEKSIIPCKGRQLKTGCYIINLRFVKVPEENTSASMGIYVLLFGVFVFITIVGVCYQRNSKTIPKYSKENYNTIGKYKFYAEQNKLVKGTKEISLSKKECELLSIFMENPNQIIKRDELTKKVWEDNGVIVGRSLDTYISKLRKKLQDDPTIKLTNIHGVGYKLEVEL